MITVRLRGQKGTFRYDLNPKEGFEAEVCNFLSQKLGIPSTEFVLYTDQRFQNFLTSETKFKRGDFIYYQFDKTLEKPDPKKKKNDPQPKEKEVEPFLFRATRYPSISNCFVDRDSGQIFSQFLALQNYEMQRCGYLYGSKTKSSWEKKKKKKEGAFEEEEEDIKQEDWLRKRHNKIWGGKIRTFSDYKKEEETEGEEPEEEEDDVEGKEEELRGFRRVGNVMKFVAEDKPVKFDYIDRKKPKDFVDIHVDAIYEPPQAGAKDSHVLMEDPLDKNIEQLSKNLGLERVGYIFSYLPDEENRGVGIFNNEELLLMARRQIKYGNDFVTVACRVINKEKMKVSFEAFQASPYCVEMVKKNLLQIDPKDPTKLVTSEPILFNSKKGEELEVAWCTVRVPLQNYQSENFNFGFPVGNRGELFKQDNFKVRGLLNKKKGKRFYETINDFHLLLYLTLVAKIFQLDDIKVIGRAIRNKSDRECQYFKDLLTMRICR